MLMATGLICLALNVYWESRGEPLQGQKAVATVTMNRAGHDPSKICDVVTAPKQFSWTNKHVDYSSGRAMLKPSGFAKEQKSWEAALHIAMAAIYGEIPDQVKGATHYHTTHVRPLWRLRKKVVAVIGNHIFYV